MHRWLQGPVQIHWRVYVGYNIAKYFVPRIGIAYTCGRPTILVHACAALIGIHNIMEVTHSAKKVRQY